MVLVASQGHRQGKNQAPPWGGSRQRQDRQDPRILHNVQGTEGYGVLRGLGGCVKLCTRA